MEDNTIKWIDNSKACALEQCERAYFWRYEKHLTSSQKSIPLQYGTMVHAQWQCILEALQSGVPAPDAFARAADVPAQWWAENMATVLPDEFDQWRSPQTANLAFIDHWQSFMPILVPNTKFLEIEGKCETPIHGTDWDFRCRQDLVMENVIVGRAIIDHKTTSWPIASVIKELEATPQIPSYCWAWNQAHPELKVTMGEINILYANKRRTKTGWGKLSTNQQLHPIVLDPNLEELMEQRLTFACNLIDQLRECNTWPLRLANCQGKYGPCEYRPLCMRFKFDPPTEEMVEEAQQLGFRVESWDPFNL